MSDVLRVAVYGPESTGKTRLAEELARHFGVECVPEFAREYADAHDTLMLEDMEPIAREQWRREDTAVVKAREKCHVLRDISLGAPLVICDTDALTTMLWSDLLYGTCPDSVRRGAEKRCRNYALYLLLDIDVPFEDDPQRCFPDPEDRVKCMRIWRGALERRRLPYELIGGNWEARKSAAIAAVERLIAGQAGTSSAGESD